MRSGSSGDRDKPEDNHLQWPEGCPGPGATGRGRHPLWDVVLASAAALGRDCDNKGAETVYRRSPAVVLAALTIFLSSLTSAGASNAGEFTAEALDVESIHHRAAALKDGEKLVSVIIKLDELSVAEYDGSHPGYAATSPSITGEEIDSNSRAVQAWRAHLQREHAVFEGQLEAAVPGAEVTRSFEVVVGGVAAMVPASQVDAISKLDGVQGVFLDQLEQVDTERSPQFIGADDLWSAQGGQQQAGEGVIVAVLDTGAWPEHPSYSDPDPFGNPYPAPPVVPGSNGFGSGIARSTCDFGNTAFNTNDVAFTCNNKLIGAYQFLDTYKAFIGLIPTEFDSARDSNGHGSHTSTTAAGNGGVAASIFGNPLGTISGIAPRAHVIAYRVCGLRGCFQSDTVAAVEQAILDGADVLNFSISGGGSPYSDPVSLAFLDAYAAGVLVNPSAGNSGPGADTVAHREPWTLTVGASTTDRHFISTVILTALNSDTLTLTGASVTDGISTATPVVLAADFGDGLCLAPFPTGTFSGEIVVCERGLIARVAKSFNVDAGGAGGLLLFNPVLQGLATDNHFIPSVHLEVDAGAALLDFLATHTGETGTFTAGVATTVQGDVMAAFSSRGGPNQTLGISKPDVTAPGVQILAAHTPLPEDITGGLPGELFQAIQGTSMSAPHSTGSAALVKASHPTWGPGEIKSALMMTAKTGGVFKEDGVTPGDPFDFGSGREQPFDASQVTVTIADTAANFVALEDSLWDANYPSLYVPVLAGRIIVDRTFQNQTDEDQEFEVLVDAPSDLVVEVGEVDEGAFNAQDEIEVPEGGSATFAIHVDARDVPLGEVRHATIQFDNEDSNELLHFPVTIVRRQAGITIDKECDPEALSEGDTIECTITIENTTFEGADVSVVDELPDQLTLDDGSVVGGVGSDDDNGVVTFAGNLFGASFPIVDVAIDPDAPPLGPPLGYIPLSIFGVAPIGGVGDETIVNFAVRAFEYAGESWTRIGMVSNGYAVVGGGTGADVDFINTNLPDPAVPNNVLAPFWTDLNPAAGGALRAAFLSLGLETWLVLDWEDVPNFGDGLPNSFQIWIGVSDDASAFEDIFFTYGDVSGGDGGFLTVGAENKFGNSGGTVFFDGDGTPPSPTNASPFYAVDVFSTPGAPGETHVITFLAVGDDASAFANYAIMSSDAFAGDAIAAFLGVVDDDDEDDDD